MKKKGAQKNNVPLAKAEVLTKDLCTNCKEDLRNKHSELFVEEDLSLSFCSEDCIRKHFQPEIDLLEKEYFDLKPKKDANLDQSEAYADLRWTTLSEPDEIWCEKLPSGYHRYYLISRYVLNEQELWNVCICLFLRGEPSFLFLAFVTKSEEMVSHYERGKKMQWSEIQKEKSSPNSAESQQTDRLASPWTQVETMRAELHQMRRVDDIPENEFSSYETCLESTLNEPDEVWSFTDDQDESAEEEKTEKAEASAQTEQPEPEKVLASPHALRYFHFLKRFSSESEKFWYVIIARETDQEDQIELLDGFPTRDPELVSQYRRGSNDLDEQGLQTQRRVVH